MCSLESNNCVSLYGKKVANQCIIDNARCLKDFVSWFWW